MLTCSKIIDAFFAKHAWLQSRNDSWSRIPWSPQRTPGTMTPKLCTKYDEKASPPSPHPFLGYFQKIGRGVRHAFWNPYPISDQNLWFSLPYFRPEALEPGAWPERVPSCYGTYTVGINIKGEMVLSPNDEDVASSKTHTQFKTRVHKPYPISDQNGRNWYPISDQNG